MFVIAFGAFLVQPTNWRPFVPTGIGGVMSGAAIVFFAFIGFDAVSTTAEETKNPQRDMPIGIMASLIICTVLYVLMAGVITGMRKYTTYLGDPAAVATAFADRPWATALISAGALAGITSVLLVFQLATPRIFMAMSRDGLMLSLPLGTWGRFFIWLAIGLSIYFAYSVRHSKLRRGVDTGITEDIPPPLIKT